MSETDEAVIDKTDIEYEEDIEEPKNYLLIGLNDNYTSQEFVTLVLQKFCHKSREEAEQIMMDIHTKEKGIMWQGIFDIAETKQCQIMSMARQFGYPFTCVVKET